MKTKRNDVLEALAKVHTKSNLRYNELYEFLKNTDQVSPNLLNFLNRSGFSESNLQTVEYELKKIHNIKDSDVKRFNAVSETRELTFLEMFLVAAAKLDKDLALKLLIILKFRFEFKDGQPLDSASNELIDFMTDESPFNSILEFFPEFERSKIESLENDSLEFLEGIEYPEQFQEEIDFLRNLPSADSKVVKEDVEKVLELFATAPDEIKTDIKFRDEFPFLSQDDCPLKLKALVTDKFGHYHEFCDAHNELFESVVLPYLEGQKPEDCEQIKNEVIFGLAKKAIVNFTGDQSIYDELLHYKETGKILGKHPIFDDEKVKENPFKDLSAQELAKKKANLENYIRRDNKKAEKAKTPAEKQKWLDVVQEWKVQISLVNTELDERK